MNELNRQSYTADGESFPRPFLCALAVPPLWIQIDECGVFPMAVILLPNASCGFGANETPPVREVLRRNHARVLYDAALIPADKIRM